MKKWKKEKGKVGEIENGNEDEMEKGKKMK